MNLKQAEIMAKVLMKEHGLDYWSFKFNRRKRFLGLCSYNRKTIELSKSYVENNNEELVKDTILHEIAHALTRCTGHDWRWKKTCLVIGCKPNLRKSEDDGLVMPKPKFHYECPNGHISGDRHKRFNAHCKICSENVVWSINKEGC